MNNKKLIIIINGKGGCGKDTLIKIFERFYKMINIGIVNINSAQPYKDIASQYGYIDNNKSNKWRKFISNLKATFEEAGIDLSERYTQDELLNFIKSDNSVMFVHIREAKNIEKFKCMAEKRIKEYKKVIGGFIIDNNFEINIVTLLIKRPDTDLKTYGNKSDDNVEEYKYDLVYENSKPENIAGYDFMIFAEENLIPLMRNS